MDVERALVSKIAQTQSMAAVIEREIEPHHFIQRRKGDTNPSPLPGEVYAWQVAHLRHYRAVPSWELTRQRWPRFEFLDSSDALEALLDEMIRQVKRRMLIESLRQGAELADDPARVGTAEVFMFEIAAELARAVPSSTVVKLSDSMGRYELYLERERLGHQPGLSLLLGWLNDVTYGIQEHELVIIEGFLGIGKSSLTIAQVAENYLKHDKTALVLSLEMEAEKLALKWDSMMAGFSYKAMKMAKLDEADKSKWEAFAEKASSSKFEKDVLCIGDIHRCTSERIYTEIERWRPDLTVVDTIDEIRAPANLRSVWEQQAWAARELKGICRTTRKPIIGVAQAGRDAETEGATLGNIAGSIDIARKADIVIGLHATQAMKRAKQMEVRILKSRDSEGDGASKMFFTDIASMTWREWTPADAVPAKP